MLGILRTIRRVAGAALLAIARAGGRATDVVLFEYAPAAARDPVAHIVEVTDAVGGFAERSRRLDDVGRTSAGLAVAQFHDVARANRRAANRARRLEHVVAAVKVSAVAPFFRVAALSGSRGSANATRVPRAVRRTLLRPPVAVLWFVARLARRRLAANGAAVRHGVGTFAGVPGALVLDIARSVSSAARRALAHEPARRVATRVGLAIAQAFVALLGAAAFAVSARANSDNRLDVALASGGRKARAGLALAGNVEHACLNTVDLAPQTIAASLGAGAHWWVGCVSETQTTRQRRKKESSKKIMLTSSMSAKSKRVCCVLWAQESDSRVVGSCASVSGATESSSTTVTLRESIVSDM